MSLQNTLRSMLEGNYPGWRAFFLRTSLYPFGYLYGCIGRLRRKLYYKNWFARHRPPLPVISVGNITAGGTGKTPFVASLCRILASMGYNPAVLMRGYGASNPEDSDEAMLYKKLLPGVKIYVGADRSLLSLEAVKDGVDIIVLDDGFQHLRLMRDVDIVLLDSICPFGGGRPLPAGMLREFLPALKNASMFVLTRTDQVSKGMLELIQERLRLLSPSIPIFQSVHRASRLYNLNGEVMPLESLEGQGVAALCGIGQPEAFASTLRGLGADVHTVVSFADHKEYTSGFLSQELSKLDRSLIPVVTEKDAVKIAKVLSQAQRQDIVVLGVDLRVSGTPQMKELLQEKIADAPVTNLLTR